MAFWHRAHSYKFFFQVLIARLTQVSLLESKPGFEIVTQLADTGKRPSSPGLKNWANKILRQITELRSEKLEEKKYCVTFIAFCQLWSAPKLEIDAKKIKGTIERSKEDHIQSADCLFSNQTSLLAHTSPRCFTFIYVFIFIFYFFANMHNCTVIVKGSVWPEIDQIISQPEDK